MAGLSVRVQLDDRALRRLTTELATEAEATVRRHALAAEATARATAPRRDGILANSHRTRMVGPLTYAVTASTPYAAAVHNGRRALDIVPKHGKFLRFQVGGRTVFARKVHQKARAGRPWLQEAVQAEQAPLERDIKQLIARP